jgi:serine/threonine-protein kinase
MARQDERRLPACQPQGRRILRKVRRSGRFAFYLRCPRGVVYRASHIYIRKPMAVKVLHRHLFDQPGAKARFLHEAQTASMVNHPTA